MSRQSGTLFQEYELKKSTGQEITLPQVKINVACPYGNFKRIQMLGKGHSNVPAFFARKKRG